MTLSEAASIGLLRRPGSDVVVCLDDEPEILSALTREFRNEPFEVLTTASPEKAFEWVESLDVGVVLSDQRMPGMLGTEFLLEVRKRSPLTRRVILTGYPWSTLQAPEAMQSVQGLVRKPWAADSLRRMIRRLLRERELPGTGGDGRPA